MYLCINYRQFFLCLHDLGHILGHKSPEILGHKIQEELTPLIFILAQNPLQF